VTSHTIPSAAFLRSDAPAPESDIQEEGDDEHSSEEEEPTPKKNFASSPPEPAPKRTVLPALSMGYIPASDSESDPDEEFNSFPPTAKIRKNRRGQRERRAIWLKKYGSNARHLHPELKTAKPAKDKNVKTSNMVDVAGTVDAGGDGSTTTTTTTRVREVKTVNDPHPSWTAKQKLREQQKTLISSVKPQKIVFD
jgi:hypothetical protein